jgi:PAS domain S-box-containing protein
VLKHERFIATKPGQPIGAAFKSKSMKKALQDHERFRILAEHSADIIFQFNLKNEQCMFASPSIEKVLGYAKEEAPSLRVQDILVPESHAALRKSLKKAIAGNSLVPSIYEIEAVHKDGHAIPFEIHVSFIQNKQGKPVEAVWVARDISDRKRLEKEVRYRADFDRLISRISSTFLKSTGFDIEEAIHQALCSIGEYIGADRAYVFQFDDNSDVIDNINEWYADGIDSQIHIIKKFRIREEFPWFTERIRTGEDFFIPSIAALPPEACCERKHFEALGVKSLITVPMISENRLCGLLGFAAVRKPLMWFDDDLSLLHFLGEIFVNALERKHREQELSESRDRLDLAIKGTDAGLWDWQVQTGHVLFDERWAEIIGYSLSELEPLSIRTWTDHCHPEDLVKSGIELEKHFAGKTDSYFCEVRMRHKKGNWVWILDRGKVVSWDENGNPVRMVGTHVDITARRQQDTLTQAERDMAALWSRVGTFKERLEVCLKTAIEASLMDSGGLYLVNADDGSLEIEVHQGLSEAFINQTRYYGSDSLQAGLVQKGETVFSGYADLIPNDQAPVILEGLKTVSVIPVHFQGRAIACLNLASHSIDNFDEQSREASKRIAAYAGSFIVQEMLEERSRQAWKDLDTLFNTIQDMFFVLDSKGFIIANNQAAANRLGFAGDELIGRHVLSVHPPDRKEEVSHIMTQMLDREIQNCHIPLITKNGEIIPVETRVILGHWKNQTAIYGICRDISERLQLEQQTRQIEKAESLSRMAGSVAHNFNNILSIVIGNIELAMLDFQHENEVSVILLEAFHASRRAADIAKQMLVYLGQSNTHHSPLDLSGACRQIIPIIQKELAENIVFEKDFPSDGPIVIGNADQIHQLVKNLMVNAAEACADRKSTIFLSLKTVAFSAIPLKRFPAEFRHRNGAYVCFEIKDSGCGIPEKDIEKIFDPFFSTKFTGRGLGLPVVLGILREHEGAISLESAPGQGSVFQAFLPIPDQYPG